MSKSIAQHLDELIQQDSLGFNHIYIGYIPPSNPVEGDLWWDTAEKRLKLYKT